MLPLILPRVHKFQGAGLKESPDKKHVVGFVQYIGPNNEWFELEFPPH